MRVWAVAVLGGTMLLAGCRSKYIQTTVVNASGAPIHVVQVDYPSASFGTQGLQDGQVYHYRFKIIGSGPLKLTFTDAKMQDHEQTGPTLHEGQEGLLLIRFPSQNSAEFQVSVHP